MAAPQFVPTPPVDKARSYASPDHIPDPWAADRPGELAGRQPEGPGLGYQGPDQGYALVLAERVKERIVVQDGEHVADAVAGCTAIALKRASLFGRAPVIHDYTVAGTIWGWFDTSPPADLLALRREVFPELSHTTVHYGELRELAHATPEATLRMSHTEVQAAYPARWRELLGR